MNSNFMIDFIDLMDPSILHIEKSDEQFEDDNWIVEPKINGRRIQCLINDDVSFAGRYGRNAHENISNFKYKFSRIYDSIHSMGLPKNTLLDGEVYLPGRPVSQTYQIINSDLNDSITLQEQLGFLVYVVFDIMAIDNIWITDHSLSVRKLKLKNIIYPTCSIELIKIIDDKAEYWQKIKKSDCEEKGVVFKFIESGYESKKSKWWKKLKDSETYDGVIMSFKFNDRYPEDFVSSIKVGQYRRNRLVEVANVSSLTKEQASDFRSNIEYYTGKVIQFKSESKTSNSYKNPRYDCLRLDKLPQSCLWEG
jgi:ATP-dependent DNA ligase